MLSFIQSSKNNIFLLVDIEMFSTTKRILLIDLYQVSTKKTILLQVLQVFSTKKCTHEHSDENNRAMLYPMNTITKIIIQWEFK